MKFKEGDIVSGYNTTILKIVDCKNHNGYNYYEVIDIKNNIEKHEFVDVYFLEYYTELDKIYSRNKKLEKIINKINE